MKKRSETLWCAPPVHREGGVPADMKRWPEPQNEIDTATGQRCAGAPGQGHARAKLQTEVS